jgi:hypothetical protein
MLLHLLMLRYPLPSTNPRASLPLSFHIHKYTHMHTYTHESATHLCDVEGIDARPLIPLLLCSLHGSQGLAPAAGGRDG